MGASFRAESLKLRRRPAVWVLALVLAITVILFGYVFSYVFVVNSPDAAGAPQQGLGGFREYLLPESFLANVLTSGLAGFGGTIALILGAMAVGSEYGWETFKVTLTQRSSRVGLFLGKLLGLGAVLLAFVLIAFVVGALSSYVVASLEGASLDWPPATEALRAVGAGWLVLATFAALGVLLATLFRGTALAIGLGLAYLLIVESLLLGFFTFNETAEAVGRALPGKNSTDLAAAFGDAPQGFGALGETADPWQATLVLAAYTAAFVLIAVLLFRRRDVA